jgi:hypothetical protein
MAFDFSGDLLQGDLALLERGKDAFLLPYSDDDFPGMTGTVNFLCSDGDQFEPMMRAHWGRCTGPHCHHVFATNGVPLRIAPGSPVGSPAESAMWCKDVLGVFALSPRVASIVIIQHWPCGLAAAHKIPLIEQLALLDEGKEALVRAFEAKGKKALEIFIGLHVDRHRGKHRFPPALYHVDRTAFRRYREELAEAA